MSGTGAALMAGRMRELAFGLLVTAVVVLAAVMIFFLLYGLSHLSTLAEVRVAMEGTLAVVQSQFLGLVARAYSALRSVASLVLDGAETLISAVRGALTRAAVDIASAVRSIYTSLENKAVKIGQILQQYLSMASKSLTDVVSHVVTIIEQLPMFVFGSLITSLFSSIATAIINFITAMFNAVFGWIVGAIKDIINLINDLLFHAPLELTEEHAGSLEKQIDYIGERVSELIRHPPAEFLARARVQALALV
jgi:phage-related protein